jgi:2,4-dienoyl-CoA reductase-like NADH-dependent reductase (Old Yellow Enzyme family)
MSNPHLDTCFSAGTINSLALKNRFIKAGTFENMTPGGLPSERLKKLHTGLADGGIAMTTIGYCAAEKDGRVKSGMIYPTEEARQPLSELIDHLHQHGTKVSVQLGHGGGFTEARQSGGGRARGPSFNINPLGAMHGNFFCDPMTIDDIDRYVEVFREAAGFLKSVGYDAIEIHFGHSYGLCQFISPLTNRRKDDYGGSLENRMRLPLRVLAAVREATGPDFPLLAKISMTEGMIGGLGLEEAIEVARMLDDGGINAIVTSGGSSMWNPSYMMKGDNLLPGMLEFERNGLTRTLMRLAKPLMFRTYPYEPVYFFEHANRVKRAVKCKMVYVGGASSNADFARLMENGFDFIQLGRSVIADPDLPLRARKNEKYQSRCNHCNRCIGSIAAEEGIYCPEFPV